jgi:alpha-glucosidase
MPWSSGLPNGGFSVVKPWLPVPREHLALAAEDQEKDSQSILQTFRRFAAWRKQHTALVTGDLALVQANEPILAFERRGDGERILCLFNFSNRDVAQPVSGPWHPLDGNGFDRARLEQDLVLLPPFGVWFGVPLRNS